VTGIADKTERERQTEGYERKYEEEEGEKERRREGEEGECDVGDSFLAANRWVCTASPYRLITGSIYVTLPSLKLQIRIMILVFVR
jgi:hypothetical protein